MKTDCKTFVMNHLKDFVISEVQTLSELIEFNKTFIK